MPDSEKNFCFALALFLEGDIVTPRKGLRQSIKILHRFHFSSALKRMSCVVSHQKGATGETFYMATVKGAPEMIKGMVRKAN